MEPSQVASGGSTVSYGGGLVDRYATALYSLADDERALDQTVDQMQALARLIDESPIFRRLLESPLIDVTQAVSASRAVLEGQGFAPMIVKFVGVIAVNRRLNRLRAIVSAFAALAAERRGVITARVATAHPLSNVQREALRARLIEAGYGQVNIEEHVDATLLGGLTRPHRRTLVRQQHKVASATPAVCHEGSRLRWRSAPPRSRRF